MSTEFSARTRGNNIKILKTEPLDVLVIGGGIVGAGLIRDLALNGGIKAGLIEQGDFASGTSSATSQLVHGGFRYLKHDRALVKMSRKEREILQRIAPNLVKPLPLAILFYKGDPYPLAGIQAAAYYYNYLSKIDKTEKSKTIRDPQKIQHLLGPIATDTLKGCVVIWDSTTDDARLTLATLKDAHRHGAVVTNYVRFLDFVNQPDTTDSGNRIYRITAEDIISRQRFEISARKIVSATGPWSDSVWCKDPSYDGMPRLIMKNAQGTHIVLPRCGREHASEAYGLVISTQSERQQGGKSRGIFILPGPHNTSIVGTTETTPAEDLSSVRPSADEAAYLLSETQQIFPEKTLNNDTIIAAYAGTRPLIAANWSSSEFTKTGFVSRDHLITESPSGVMYLYGGKLTTHRQMAEETVDHLATFLNVPRRCKTDTVPLSNVSAETPNGNANHASQSNIDTERLIKRYGDGYQTILKFINDDATLAEPITPSLSFTKAELLYAYWGEMAITLTDLLWRRTRIGWTPGQGLDLAPQIAQFLSKKNNWDQARITAEVEVYREHIRWLNFYL
ncbi:MAG: glycerol-3-phosphate dehydrogenase/oxidase [Candidatus Poribacteria bacterium]|nr:glycerol-3-phosphate dehydrogenase/oxidase [Candidatus Poribacteria bacterium]